MAGSPQAEARRRRRPTAAHGGPGAPGALASVALAALAVGLGCAGHAHRTERARQALDAGKPEHALTLLNKELKVDDAESLPADLKSRNALLVLDRAMVLQSLDRYELSSRDLEAADKAIEVLDFSRGAMADVSKYLFSDASGPYRAPPYEKLLINTMGMTNYLVRRDLSGARVEARRFSVMTTFLADSGKPGATESLMGPGSYLAGLVMEKSKEYDEALRYYDEALGRGSYGTLREPVRRLARRSGYRSPRIQALLEGGAPTSQAPTWLSPVPGWLAAGGAESTRALRQQAKVAPAPDTWASAWLPAGRGDDVLGWSAPFASEPRAAAAVGDAEANGSTGALPDAEATPAEAGDEATDGSSDSESATADDASPATDAPADAGPPADEPDDPRGELIVLLSYGRVPAKEAQRVPIGLALTWAALWLPTSDVAKANELAAQGLVTWINFPTLEEREPQYTTPRAWVDEQPQPLELLGDIELETRASWDSVQGAVAASAITRMITRIAVGQGMRQVGDDGVGIALSLITQATMTAADTPDTRSWSTLPGRISVGRYLLPPGSHSVRLSASGRVRTFDVELPPEGWAVVTLTELR